MLFQEPVNIYVIFSLVVNFLKIFFNLVTRLPP